MKNLDTSSIAEGIMKDGFFILKNKLPKEEIEKLREKFLHDLASVKPTEDIVWDPYIGERDKICYSKDRFQSMYRGYSFPWNHESSQTNKNLLARMNTLREQISNLINCSQVQRQAELSLYTTWSYYPPNQGWLGKHSDKVKPGTKLIHYIVPLTFKGIDFDKGGLYITDRSGKEVDIDIQLKPGDAVFFDGSCEHEVKLVESSTGLGRMQTFAIPVEFKYPDECDRFLAALPLRSFAVIKIKNALNKIKIKLLNFRT